MTEGKITLEEFFDDVARVQSDRRFQENVTVYFMHESLTPENVRARWDDTSVGRAPVEGAVLDMPGAGYMGEDARWRVLRQEWHPGAAVTLHCADA